jgi:hypothetical protein
MAEVIINNLDRILITAGLVAGFFAGKWVAAFVAARVATFSLAAALTTLRTALIRTGIGAVVVLAGEAVYQFTRLTSAVGSIGEAMGLLGDVAVEVWGRIKDGASAMVMSIKATFLEMEGSFLGAISRMAMKASDFFMSMSEGVANIPGMEGLAGGLMSASNAFLRGAASTSQAGQMSINQAGGMREQAAGLFAGLSGPLESVQKIRDLLASIKDERITLPDLLGVPGGDSEGGGKKKTPLEEQTEAQIASLQALRDQGRETWSALGTFLQQFAGKSKAAAIAAIAIQKGLSIAQIISNTAAAQMRALAELGPIAGPPVAAKMGLYGKLQAGLVAATGLAQAMGSGGSAGSASPSLGGGAGTTQPAQPPQPTQTVSINLQGDTFSRSSVEGLLEQIQSQLDRGGRLVFQ